MTGNVQFAARDYDPATGVWTQADPLGLGAGDLNDYQFVNGNPVNGTDPTGMWSISGAWSSLKQSVTTWRDQVSLPLGVAGSREMGPTGTLTFKAS